MGQEVYVRHALERTVLELTTRVSVCPRMHTHRLTFAFKLSVVRIRSACSGRVVDSTGSRYIRCQTMEANSVREPICCVYDGRGCDFRCRVAFLVWRSLSYLILEHFVILILTLSSSFLFDPFAGDLSTSEPTLITSPAFVWCHNLCLTSTTLFHLRSLSPCQTIITPTSAYMSAPIIYRALPN